MDLPPLGLYIHLPWCARKCPYCDFNSHERNEIPEALYVDALLQDLRSELPLLQGREIGTLFIGGGTPSLFSPKSIRRLLREIADLAPLSSTLEATMEANPGSAEAGKFVGFREAGINRLSIGVQSFNPAQLHALGRVHDGEEAHAALRYAREAGFDSINIDLMHGLPGQSPKDACADLRCAIDWDPAHLSWYQLTIEPNTAFFRRPPALPAEDDLEEIQHDGAGMLLAAGYAQYEVSAHSKPGLQCRHNHNYWSFGDYLGIGAGAHGKLTFPDGRIQRYAKRRQPQDYMDAAQSNPVASRRLLGAADIAGEFMLNALRLNAGFAVDDFEKRTGLLLASVKPSLDSLCERGLLEQEGGQIKTSRLGRRFLDTVVGEFFPG